MSNEGIAIIIIAFMQLSIMPIFIHMDKRIKYLENEKQERLDYLTDPEVIDAELERSARRREAFDSKMAYPPRKDSGPAAVIKEPNITPWGKSAQRFNREPIYKGQDRPQRYLPNQSKKD